MKRIWWPICLLMLSRQNHVHHEPEKVAAALRPWVRLWKGVSKRQDHAKTRLLRATAEQAPSCPVDTAFTKTE